MTFRTTDAGLRADFLSFLTEDLGYPRDAILLEHPLPAQQGRASSRADMLVTDPDTLATLALIEITTHKTPATQEDAYLQVRRNLESLAGPVPAFLVMNSVESTSGFEIFALQGDGKWQQISRHEFPFFRALAARAQADRKVQVTRERRMRFDVVKTSCYAGALVLLLLFLLSICGVFTPSTTELGILTGAVLLAVLPNAARLKALGFEFERLNKD